MRSGRRGAWVGSLTAARGLAWQGAPSKGARARFARWSWSFRWRLVTLPPVKLPSPRRARRARRSCGCERGWRSTAMGRWRVPSACTLWRARARWRRRRTTTTTTTMMPTPPPPPPTTSASPSSLRGDCSGVEGWSPPPCAHAAARSLCGRAPWSAACLRCAASAEARRRRLLCSSSASEPSPTASLLCATSPLLRSPASPRP
mmetsp:Transcript_21279/g.69728  ORF Transcript_21279/g.69728 Transcript_21279/m.69728 type:complete len:203 (-) Transcript_21279:361-969(-)